MDLVSHVCYEYIRSFKDSRFDKRLTYYLAHSKSMRNAIKKVDGGYLDLYESKKVVYSRVM